MEKEETKKKLKLKWQIKLFLIIAFFIIYIFCIGTKGIFINDFTIKSNKISNSMNGLKILHFTDLHYGSTVNEKTLKKLIKKINLTKPDIVIFTGDLIDERYEITKKEEQTLEKQLKKINASLGKYYVTGEEDKKNTETILNLSGFININETEQLIYKNDTTPILLIGEKNISNYIKSNEENNYFKLLAIHNPKNIDKYLEYNIDIIISGHTHNGQINIPKLKELFIEGNYINNYKKINNTEIFINPGIGTSKVNARLFNHPKIYLYRINKTSI